jgi:hypothetical protein
MDDDGATRELRYPALVTSSQRFPTWKHALVTLFGSGALTASSCVGCQVALDIGGGGGELGEAIPVVLAILVLAGLLGTFVGALFVLMRVLHALFGKKDESETNAGSAS